MQQPTGSRRFDIGAEEADYIFAAAAPGVAQAVTTISNVCVIVLGWWSMILEVFLRYEFGERYLTFVRMFFAGTILFVIHKITDYWTFSYGGEAFGGTVVNPYAFPHDTLWSWFVLGFFLLTANHFVQIWLRNKRQESWHSRSFGISRLEGIPLPGGNDWALYRFYEPAFCFIITLIIGRVDNVTSFVVGIGTAALFLKNNLLYYQYRSISLDLLDAKIESEYYNAAAEGKPKEKTAGMSVVRVVMPKMPAAPNSMEDIEKTVQEAQAKKPRPASPSTRHGGDDLDFSDTISDTLKHKDKH